MEQTLLLPVDAPVAPAYPTIRESWAAAGWLILISALAALAVMIPVKVAGYFVGEVRLTLEFLLGAVGLLLTILWLRRRAGPRRWVGPRAWQHPGRCMRWGCPW